MQQIYIVTYTYAFLFSLATTHAADAPALKEGLWSIHKVTTSNPGNKVDIKNFTLCRSHAFDQQADAKKNALKDCTTVFDFTRNNTHTTEMRCVVGGSILLTKSVATMADDRHTHSDAHATFTPVFDGQTETTIVEDQSYRGKCPAGLQPGDEVQADGTVLHLWKH